MSIEKNIVITNKLGLHARAAAKLAKLAGGFDSTIALGMGEKTADAKSIMGIMMLAATQGSELTIVAQGRDAENAVDAVCQIFADCFGESE